MWLRILRWSIPFGLVVLLLSACSDDADDVAATSTVPSTTVIETTTTEATTTTTVSTTTTSVASEDDPAGLSVDELPPSVAAFKTAYESGDLETIQALFADDGIITTTDKMYDLYWGGTYHLGTWEKEGSEFRRLASIHQGEMTITRVIEMEGVVAFDWDWEDFASGTAVLHLRDDKIVVAMLTVSGDPIPAP